LSWTWKAKRTVPAVLGLCCLIPGWGALQPALAQTGVLRLEGPLPGKTGLTLSADRLTGQPGRNEIALVGSVHLDGERLSVRCTRLTVKVDEKGRPLWIEAEGEVRLAVQGSKAWAQRLTLSLKEGGTGAVALSGNARLEIPTLGVGVTGRRIGLDLATGQFTVHQARAVLRPGGRRGGGDNG